MAFQRSGLPVAELVDSLVEVRMLCNALAHVPVIVGHAYGCQGGNEGENEQLHGSSIL